MIRSIGLCGGLVLVVIAGGSAAAQGANQPRSLSAPGVVAAPTAASWSCQDGRCTYRKAQGGWSDCFTSWSPTHGGWAPTRYCR